MKLETSWDDGSKYDLQIGMLLHQYGLTGTFYIPTNTMLTKPEIRALADSFEVGGHTINHLALTKIPLQDAENEIIGNKAWLENIIGKPVTKFCYPRGYYNQAIIELVKAAGYTEARTVGTGNTRLPLEPFIIKPTVHLYPERYAMFEDMLRSDSTEYFHAWGHGWEVEKFGLWKELESILSAMQKTNERL